MQVKLTYFKGTGKFYAEGEYTTEKAHLHEIWAEVSQRWWARDLPGLVRGCTQFFTLVDVPDHPHNHPHIVGMFERGVHQQYDL